MMTRENFETMVVSAIRAVWDTGPDSPSTRKALDLLNTALHVPRHHLTIEVCAGQDDLLIFASSDDPEITAENVIHRFPFSYTLPQVAAYIEFKDAANRIWIIKDRFVSGPVEIKNSARNRPGTAPWVFPKDGTFSPGDYTVMIGKTTEPRGTATF